jgi:beta-glucosidase
MKKSAVIFVTLLFAQISFAQIKLTDQQKADAILRQLTLDEKIGQMTQVALGVVCTQQDGILDAAALQNAIQHYKVGSSLNVTGHALTLDQWHVVITQI